MSRDIVEAIIAAIQGAQANRLEKEALAGADKILKSLEGKEPGLVAAIVGAAFGEVLGGLMEECPRCAGELLDSWLKDFSKNSGGKITYKLYWPTEHGTEHKETAQ